MEQQLNRSLLAKKCLTSDNNEQDQFQLDVRVMQAPRGAEQPDAATTSFVTTCWSCSRCTDCKGC